MNHLATVRRDPLSLPPGPLPLPALSPPLAMACNRIAEGIYARWNEPPTSAMVAEAKAALEGVTAACAPARPSQVETWLFTLGTGARNPPTPDGLAVLTAAVAVACDHLPAWCFNRTALREAMRAFAFMPGSADVAKLLSESNAIELRRIAAMRSIAAAKPVDPAPEATPEEREAARAHVAATLSALPQRAGRPAPPGRRAAQLTPEQLAAARAAAGITHGVA